MSGTAESFAQDFHRSPTLDRAEILKLQTEMQDKNLEIEDDAQKRYGVYDELKRKRENVTTSRHGQDILRTQTKAISNHKMMRKIPTTVKLYPLTHTTLGTGAFSFPNTDKKFGARIDTPGTKYIVVGDHARLNHTDKLSAEYFGYFPATTGGDGDQIIFGKGNSSRPYEMLILAHATQPNTLRIKIATNAPATYNIDFVYTPNTWYHIAVSWKGSPDNRLKLYIDGVQSGATVTTSGALTTNSSNLGIFGSPDGTALLKANTRLAHLTLLYKEIDSTHISNHKNGLLDTSAANTDEILTIPGYTDERPRSDSALCFLIVS